MCSCQCRLQLTLRSNISSHIEKGVHVKHEYEYKIKLEPWNINEQKSK